MMVQNIVSAKESSKYELIVAVVVISQETPKRSSMEITRGLSNQNCQLVCKWAKKTELSMSFQRELH